MMKTVILTTMAAILSISLIAASAISAQGQSDRALRYNALNAKVDSYHREEAATLAKIEADVNHGKR